jgi:TonB-dependent SusC/RagA subfamily outer membrane receptor
MRKIVFLSLLLAFSVILFAQTRTLTGKVVDASGTPVSFASINIKGTSFGVSADANGDFKISVTGAETLVVSATGYVQQEVAATGSNIVVTLATTGTTIEEVVVTALGIRRNRNDLNYSAQSINAEGLEKASQTDALKALSGKIAGVQITSSTGTPGGSSYIQLRGANSITGNNEPLFVIDGVPIDNSQNYSGDPADGTNNLLFGATNTNRGADINPNDIESITVLKGPSAAALYGINAANGAIIITTKSGKAGRAQIEFNSSVTFDWANRLPGLQNQWIKGSGGAIGRYPSSDRYSWGAKVDTLFRTGIANDFDKSGFVVGKSNPKAKIPFTPYDNMKQFFRTAPSYTN